jgi:chemotaxis protein MotB
VPAEDFDSEYSKSGKFEGYDDYESDDEAHSSGGGDGTWLMSYADLMTLVACFFIMLVAFANFDDSGFQGKALEFARFFRGAVKDDVGDEEVKAVLGKDTNKETVRKVDTKIDPESIKNLSTHIHKLVKTAGISEISKPKDVKVVFSGSAMFAPGKVVLEKEVSDSIDVMVDLIQARKTNFMILFEGHTDDSDIKNQVYPSNWELSAARASAVLKKFEMAGIPSDRMVAIGYGDSRPIYDNRDRNGQAIQQNQILNRRVEIKVLHRPEASNEKLGLGIFFRENKGKNIPPKDSNPNK